MQWKGLRAPATHSNTHSNYSQDYSQQHSQVLVTAL